MESFVKTNGLTEVFNQAPSEDYKQHALKEELQLQTTQVQGLVRQEREHSKKVSEATEVMAKAMSGVGQKAESMIGYTGRSGSVRSRNEAALGKQFEAFSAGLAGSLAAGYQVRHPSPRPTQGDGEPPHPFLSPACAYPLPAANVARA